MDFSDALHNIKQGREVRRAGWNGKGMSLFIVSNWMIVGTTAYNAAPNLPFIAMKTVDGKIVPWLASQSDILADDWELV